jgi:APA family basic amino acid/polyamine antiporter
MEPTTPTDESFEKPRRVIGGMGSLALVVGSMLGIGIFIVPPQVAKHIGSVEIFGLIWLLGGVLAFAGAVACAELGSMIPKAGGDYVFQKEAYGPSVAFASGWVLFGAIFAGSIATMSVALCKYQLPILVGWFRHTVGMDPVFAEYSLDYIVLQLPILGDISMTNLCALGLVALLTGINAMGALLSARMQTLLIAVPLGFFTIGAVIVLSQSGGGISVSEWQASLTALTQTAAEGQLVSAGAGTELSLEHLVMAYIAVYFAYSGWNAVIYVAGEIKHPEKNIPRALLGGTISVTVVYLLMALAFVVVLGIDALAGSGEAGTAVATYLSGFTGKIIITSLIAMALLAGLNGTVMGGARVAMAMGRNGAFLKAAGKLSPKTGAPIPALGLQFLWGAVLVLSGSFETLLALTSLAMLVTGTLTVSSVFVLRYSQPDRPRPYRAFGYPILPALYLISSVLVISVMVHKAFSDGEPGSWYPLMGLGILVLAYTAHRLTASLQVGRRYVAGSFFLILLVGGLVFSQWAGPSRAEQPTPKPTSTLVSNQ